MARILYLDCFAGVAGDMLLGALVDLGCRVALFKDLLEALPIDDVQIEIDTVMRGPLQAQLVSVTASTDQPYRQWTDIDAMLKKSRVPDKAKARARQVFRRLAEAEGAVHGHSADTVHFHEVGAIDSIVDIVGACWALEELKIDRLICSPLPLGYGTLSMAHGNLPLPAPATVELLQGFPVRPFDQPVETVTPTGAALLTTLADSFGLLPPMKIAGVGYGAGTRINASGPPNVVRAILGEDEALPETAETTYNIETNIDDMNPEHYGPLAQRLEEAGAVDVTLVPCFMKHQRPGVLLKVLCPQSALEAVIEAIFVHSTTLGLRYFPSARAVCERKIETVKTDFGPVRIKRAFYMGREVHAKPEFADLLRSGLPLGEAERKTWEAVNQSKSKRKAKKK